METCSFGERICGNQGYEELEGSEEEADDNDVVGHDEEQPRGERFTSARYDKGDGGGSQGEGDNYYNNITQMILFHYKDRSIESLLS